jgi:signal peptidase I
VANHKFEALGPVYADIGGELAEIVGGDPDGVYLYAEAGEGWYGYGVFKDEGDKVRYFDPTSELGDLIYHAWLAEESDKRWAVMEYEISGTNFDAKFQFPDEIDPKESETERRPRALKKRYGDKPIIYPPLPPHLATE